MSSRSNPQRTVRVTIRHCEAGNIDNPDRHPVALAFKEATGEDAEVSVREWRANKKGRTLCMRWPENATTVFTSDLPQAALAGKTGLFKLKWTKSALQ